MGDNNRDPGAILRSAAGVLMHIRQIHGWLARFFGMFHRARREREFAEELESHLAFHIEDNLRAGMSPEEARRQARIKLGGVTQAQELHREQRGLPMLETLWQDLRFGARMLLKNPSFSLIAVLTLALGIGANTAIFSVINTVLLGSLPYKEAERVVVVWSGILSKGIEFEMAPGEYFDFRDRNSVFAQMAATEKITLNLTGNEEALALEGGMATASLFPLLGVAPLVGRTFTPEEDRANARVAVLSYHLWQNRFAGEREIVGREIILDSHSYTVIGVMPAEFQFPPPLGGHQPGEVWVPRALETESDRTSH